MVDSTHLVCRAVTPRKLVRGRRSCSSVLILRTNAACDRVEGAAGHVAFKCWQSESRVWERGGEGRFKEESRADVLLCLLLSVS